MERPRVLVTSPFLRPGDEADRLLHQAGIDTVHNPWHGARTEDEMIEILRGIDGAIVSSDPFTEKVFDGATRLKVVVRTGVGYDAIDVGAATAHKVAVCTSPGSNSVAVAEFAFALMLACARKLKENLAEVEAAGWTRHQGPGLEGATLGLVGLGSIGKAVARRACAFDMRVIAYDQFQDEEFAQKHEIAYMSLEELLKQSDYVSLHVLLSKSTRHLINAQRLSLMKSTAYLINTARGPVVDTEALYQALKGGRIAGAGLDVFEHEPLDAGSLLRSLTNVYLTPHVGGSSLKARRIAMLMCVENVTLLLSGRRPPHMVNPESQGYMNVRNVPVG